jgi:hypothetical protein
MSESCPMPEKTPTTFEQLIVDLGQKTSEYTSADGNREEIYQNGYILHKHLEQRAVVIVEHKLDTSTTIIDTNTGEPVTT